MFDGLGTHQIKDDIYKISIQHVGNINSALCFLAQKQFLQDCTPTYAGWQYIYLVCKNMKQRTDLSWYLSKAHHIFLYIRIITNVLWKFMEVTPQQLKPLCTFL